MPLDCLHDAVCPEQRPFSSRSSSGTYDTAPTGTAPPRPNHHPSLQAASLRSAGSILSDLTISLTLFWCLLMRQHQGLRRLYDHTTRVLTTPRYFARRLDFITNRGRRNCARPIHCMVPSHHLSGWSRLQQLVRRLWCMTLDVGVLCCVCHW